MPRKPGSKYKVIDLFGKDGEFLPDAMVEAMFTTPEQRDAALLESARVGLARRAEAKRQAAAVRLAGHVATVIAAAPVGLTGEALAEWMRETRPFCDWDARRIARVVKAISII